MKFGHSPNVVGQAVPPANPSAARTFFPRRGDPAATPASLHAAFRTCQPAGPAATFDCTNPVHNGVMPNANRFLVDLVENRLEAVRRKQKEFFDLAVRFRTDSDPEEVRRLGDQMGKMVFGA